MRERRPDGTFKASDPLERFWVRVRKDEETGCFIWTGARDRNGYGYFGVGTGKMRLAHLWAYQRFVGLVPTGLELDHLCKNKSCVNWLHLEPVTHEENMRRVVLPSTLKMHCPQGHPYSPENTQVRIKKGRAHRGCKTCKIESQRRIRSGKRINK